MRLIYHFILATFLGALCTACSKVPQIIENTENGSLSKEEALPNGNKSIDEIAYEVAERHPDGSVTVNYSVVRYVPETRERIVTESHTRKETRTRTVTGEDGKSRDQEYTVEVPYTEDVLVTETVQVPVTEARQVIVPEGTDIQDYLRRLE